VDDAQGRQYHQQPEQDQFTASGDRLDPDRRSNADAAPRDQCQKGKAGRLSGIAASERNSEQ